MLIYRSRSYVGGLPSLPFRVLLTPAGPHIDLIPTACDSTCRSASVYHPYYSMNCCKADSIDPSVDKLLSGARLVLEAGQGLNSIVPIPGMGPDDTQADIIIHTLPAGHTAPTTLSPNGAVYVTAYLPMERQA